MSKQGRIRTQELRKAQEETARRKRNRQRTITVVGGLVVAGLVAAIAFVVLRAITSDDGPATASGEVVQPANVTSDGAITVGEDGAPVTVEVYFDYMCPACGAFEQVNGDELDRMIGAGDITLLLRPISFLDRMSNGTEYSTRSANAVATVADGAPEAVWDFHRALYESQPAEGTDGLPDEQIADIALEAGVPQSVVDRFADGTHEAWVASVTDAAFESGVDSTPTIKIDGEIFLGDWATPGTLTAAIEAAGAGG